MPSVAIDTETLGLNPHRDRLCLVQLSSGDGSAHLVQFDGSNYAAPNLKALLADPAVLKIFHYARFDIAVMEKNLGVVTAPIYCTKIASKLVRTYTDRHGLKDLVGELVGIELSKQQQSSDWASSELSQQQLAYAASDVLHLHALKARLDAMLGAGGAARVCGGRVRVPANARQARSGRLRRGRYFLPLTGRLKLPAVALRRRVHSGSLTWRAANLCRVPI